MKNKKGLLISGFLLLSISLFAEKISFSANSMTGQAGNSNSTTRLAGSAYIVTETMEISSDYIELSGDDYRFIKAEGNVVGKNIETNMEFTCNQLEYDRTTKVASLKGNVNLVDVDNNVRADAQMIDYNQDTNIAILQIKINLTQKDNVCTGEYAVYQKDEQLLELSGNAQIKQKDDTFRAQHITLNMDTQEITLDGNVKGSVKDTKEKKVEKSEAEADSKIEKDDESAESKKAKKADKKQE